jgi:uncharacterized protein
VKDPHEVVKAGDVVRVRVLEVDVKRKRISMTMRKDGGGEASPGADRQPREHVRGPKTSAPPPRGKNKSADMGAFGAALADAMRRK